MALPWIRPWVDLVQKSIQMCGVMIEYFIPTKFGKYPSSDSVVKADYVFSYIYCNVLGYMLNVDVTLINF